jgi:hypothetical protein
MTGPMSARPALGPDDGLECRLGARTPIEARQPVR